MGMLAPTTFQAKFDVTDAESYSTAIVLDGTGQVMTATATSANGGELPKWDTPAGTELAGLDWRVRR